MSSDPRASDDQPEAFPSLTPTASAASNSGKEKNDGGTSVRGRAASVAASVTQSIRRTRGTSLLQTFQDSSLPLGMWQATGEVSSKIPTLPEIKNGSFSDEGWSHEGQLEKRNHKPHDIHRRRMSSMSRRKGTRSDRALTLPEKFQHLQDYAVPEETDPEVGEGTKIVPPQPDHLSKRASTAPSRVSSDMKTLSTTMNAPVTFHASQGPDETGTYPNGYRFPKKHTWTQTLAISSKAFWKFFKTPFGFCITFYGLNVVGWGAMIFFVLLNAAPAMCHPTCDAISSPRKKWIERDSQILNALFDVTGLGLLPWRCRDCYYLIQWKFFNNHEGHRRLAGLYRGWYRLPGSENIPEDVSPPSKLDYKRLMHPSKKAPEIVDDDKPHFEKVQEHIDELEVNPAVPHPVWAMPQPPLTGIRAQPTKKWQIDTVIWMYMGNSVFQIALTSCMWYFNRFTRPSWTTGLFITLGCLTGIAAGIVTFIEGSKVKKVEGIPVEEYDVLESIEDYHARKEKEDEKIHKHEVKQHKKEEKHDKHHHPHHHHDRKVVGTEKVKGQAWFQRH